MERNRNRKEEVEVVVGIMEEMEEMVMEIVHCKLKILILYEKYI